MRGRVNVLCGALLGATNVLDEVVVYVGFASPLRARVFAGFTPPLTDGVFVAVTV